MVTLDRHGNTSAAVRALDEAVRDGRRQDGGSCLKQRRWVPGNRVVISGQD